MIWGLILQVLALIGSIMGTLVTATYSFGLPDPVGAVNQQWNGTVEFGITEKGNSIISSLMTIVHYGLDFVAQFMLLLPAQASLSYDTASGLNMMTTASPK